MSVPEACWRALEEVVGPERVLRDEAELACYSFDFFPGERWRPEAAVVVTERAQVPLVLRIAAEHRLPVTPRGSGTGVTGGAVPRRGGLVLDLSALRRVLEVDPEEMLARVEPGVIWEELNECLRPHGLWYPSTPGSLRASTVGGSVATGGSGMRAIKYGTTRHNVLQLLVALAGGEVVRLGSRAPKTSCGYDLKDLFVGSEGTLGVALEITLRLHPLPERRVVLRGWPQDLGEVGRLWREVRRRGVLPSALEFVPASTLRLAGEPARGAGEVILELDGMAKAVEAERRALGDLFEEELAGQEALEAWHRHSEVYFRLVRGTAAPLAEDLGLPPDRLPQMIQHAERLAERLGLEMGMVSHLGDGTLHCVIRTDGERTSQAQRLRDELYRKAVELGGTITAEHGLGLSRLPWATAQLGTRALELMRAIKAAWDPWGILNPGKLGS